MCTGPVPHNQTCLTVNMSADPVGMMAGLLVWCIYNRHHTGRCCFNMDACWTVATQSSCRSFVTQSCMSAGAALLYLPYLLVWCLTTSPACWCDASLKAISSGVVPHYQPCQLVRCLILAIPSGVVLHYRPCLLVWCLTISHSCWCIASL